MRGAIDDTPSKALRERSPDLLLSGLIDLLRRGEQNWLADWRDMLIALAPFHDAAHRLGVDVPAFFDRAADAGPDDLSEHVREFGRRRDVTPENFGYRVEETEAGLLYQWDVQ